MKPFLPHINLYDLASLGTLFTGLTLTLLLLLTKKPGRLANLFLALGLVAIIFKACGVTSLFLPALGPLLYFYVRQLTCTDMPFRRKDMLHFCPLLLGYWLPEWLVLISVTIYLYLSHGLIERFYARLRPVLMDRPRFAFRRLGGALLLTGLACFLAMVNDFFCFVIALILIVIAIDAIVKPDGNIQLTMPITDRSDAKEKGRRLKEAIAAGRLYEDAELTLATLAIKLNIHPHDLSRVINNGLEKTFSDLINEFRVREVARKMHDPAYDKFTLLHIGYESGFNSQRTFNRVFKEITGKTPIEYKSSLKKGLPIDKLAILSGKQPIILRSESPPQWGPSKLNRSYMFKNYLKIAFRSLSKSKSFTALNVTGLAAGLGVCLLIVLYVTDEISYDRYNVNADRIYRIDEDLYFNNTQYDAVTTSKFFGPTLVASYPNIQQMVRFRNPADLLIRKGNDHITDRHFTFADSTIFKVFTLQMIAGDPNTALNNPHSIVIDESAARRYFNSTDVVGRILEVGNNNTPLKITGVMRDMPEQSQFHFSFIRPIREAYNFNDPSDNDWVSNAYYTYILAKPGTTRAEVQKDVDEVVNRNISPALQGMFHASAADLEKAGNHFRCHIFPLTDVHLHSNKAGELEANSNIQFIYIFSIIAVLILLVACVNFMNLSTARSANRAREVGIRKVIGSTKGHLIIQFLTESTLLSLFSLALALGIAVLLLPVFNQLAGKSLHAGMLFSGRFLPMLILLVLLVGCVAGSYPAFYLSSFQPIHVLKGKMAAGFKGSWLRSGLVVFQFFISIGLIVSTLVIYRQLHYIRNKDVGYNRDQVLVIHGTWPLGRDGTANLRKDLLSIAAVSDATVTPDLPTVDGQYWQEGWFPNAPIDARKATIMTTLRVDDHYVPTLGMQIVNGRNFDLAKFPSDSTAIILNEAAVATLGVKNPLNMMLYNHDDKYRLLTFHVIGVVKDFNYNSMHDKIRPLLMVFNTYNWSSMAVRFRTNDVADLIRQVEGKFHAARQGLPFNHTFMDNDFDKLYHAEQQTGRIFIAFAIFAILIACLGLFGLVTYAAEQRTKEIGIRKVLGASVSSIVGLISKEFTVLVAIAAIIAFPSAWWAMRKWLDTFAYRTEINWWIFLLAGIAAFAIALLTVSVQTMRAALANPIKSLRSE